MIESTGQAASAPDASTVVVSTQKRVERFSLIAAVVLVYGLLAVMLVFVMPGLFGFKTYSGTGSSMGDTIPDGSLIVTRAVASEDVEIGDVIAFRWPGFEHTITHRVIGIRSQGDVPVFITMGDGNQTRDPFPTSGDQQIRQVVYSAPYLGSYLPVARSLIYVLAFAGGFILWRRHRRRRLALAGELSVVASHRRGDEPAASTAAGGDRP